MIEQFPVEVIDAALLRAQPGDLIILRTKAGLTDGEAERIRDLVRSHLPADVNVMVMTEDVAVETRPASPG